MTDNLLILCLLLSTIVVLSEAQSTGRHCETPDNRNGYCIPIRSCDVLFRIATKKVLFAEDRAFLIASKCGNGRTDVCCPDGGAISITPTTLSTSPTTSTATSTTPIQTNSKPLESAIRISVKKCSEYADYAYNKTYTVNIRGDVPRVTRTTNCALLGEGLVVGGEDAKRREFPHMALIGYRYDNRINWDCGGTLISERFVLSAEHCSYSERTGSALYVRLGEHDISRSDDANHIDFDIIDRIRHKNVPQRSYNDIILFKLNREVKFDHVIRPACLPQQIAVPRNVSASGWGRTSSAGSPSDVLQKVDLTNFSLAECNKTRVGRWYSREYDEGSIVFAGHLDRRQRKDTCQGDSGGPLQVLHEKHHCTYVVVGITSIGDECAKLGKPAIYTGVYSHLDWIVETVWPNEYNEEN